MTEIVSIEHLNVVFRRWGESVSAICDLSLSIYKGEWMMIIGHNGSGKSTLLKVLAGQIKPSSGQVLFRTAPLSKIANSRIYPPTFLLEQNPLASASAKLTLIENLKVAHDSFEIIHRPARALGTIYMSMLKSAGLESRANQLARYLSGGERQLLSLLIARLRPSPILLLDEPLAALDPAKADLCLRLIRDLHSEGRTIVQISHDHELAYSTGDRIVEMKNGTIAGIVSRQKISSH